MVTILGCISNQYLSNCTDVNKTTKSKDDSDIPIRDSWKYGSLEAWMDIRAKSWVYK